MKILSKNSKLILGSTAIAVVLSSAAAFSQQYGAIANGEETVKVDTAISTSGDRAYGLLAMNGGIINSTADITTTTSGAKHVSHSVQAGGNGVTVGEFGDSAGIVNLTAGKITFEGSNWGTALHAVDEGLIDAKNVAVISNSYGAIAESGSKINIANSKVTTSGNVSALVANNDLRKNGTVGGILNVSDTSVITSGANAAGVSAEFGGTATITGGSITTSGFKSYGVRATEGGTATIVGGDISTSGDRAYGLLAMNGGIINSTADITTTTSGAKHVSHSVQAGGNGVTVGEFGDSAGIVNLTAGKITFEGSNWGTALHAVDEGLIDAKNVAVISNSYGAIAESGSKINIANSKVTTSGNVSALVANNDLRKNGTVGGILNISNTSVNTSGTNAAGVSAEFGGTATITGGSITTTGENASAVAVIGSGTVTVSGTTLSSANAATASVQLNTSDDVANVTFGNGTVVTNNNGTLLQVNRNGTDNGGIVNFTLKTGSETTGDIVDTNANATGFTNFTTEAGAKWTGLAQGVKDINTQAGSSLSFGAGTVIAGDVNGVTSNFTFDSSGGQINGNVGLKQGSVTKGGSISSPISVGGNVFVDETSVMGGNWSVAGNLGSSGIITPGNSIGLVKIGQDLVLSDSSVYEVEVDADGQSDRIDVVGTATLNGIVNVTPLGGYQLGSAYTILTANSFGGTTFDSVSWNEKQIFITPELSYKGQDANAAPNAGLAAPNRSVELTLNRNDVAFASVAETSNQVATANALDSLALGGPLMNSVSLLDASSARSAFEQLSGDVHASVKTGLIDTANLTADAINNRLRSAFEGVGAQSVPVMSFAQSPKGSAPQPFDAATPTSLDYGVWASGFGSWVNHDGNSNAGGLKTSTGGFLSGVDVGLNSGWRLGVVGGYSQTDLDGKGRNSSANSDNWHLGIYGGNQWGPIGLRAGLVHTWHSIDSSRGVSYAGYNDSLEADYHARTLQAFGELGYRIDTTVAAFEPFANLSHVRLHTDGFTENGGVAALTVNGNNTNTTFTTLGMRASAPLSLGSTNANLKGTLGWRHAYGDITPNSTQLFAGSNPFTVDGIAIAKDAALVEAGFDVPITEAAKFGVSYVGQFGSGTKQNGFNATLNVKF
ncbi:autotransporter domain-containing protein [Brucella sp. 21LCYQ03]|nr:autotransporter domain-containing protein [Brucella sp. 21LCYQ03]